MSNDTTLTQRLEQAGSSAAQSWIITELLLNAYSATLRQAVLAAAVPHWFTADILAALLDLSAAQAQECYADLQQLSIVQPFGDLGYTLHNLTRSGILTYRASQAPEEVRYYSQRVQSCFTVQAAAPDTQTEVESSYHQLIVNAAKGRAMLKQQARTYRGKGNFAAVENLLRNYRELIELGLLENEDRAELERQKYWTAEALANRGKKEKSDEGVHYLRKALEQFAPPEQLPTLLADEPTQWREQIDTYKRDFVYQQVEAARSASDLALQPFWLAELGDLYRDQGNLEASLQQLDEALTLAPENARAWAYRGVTKRQMKQYEEALADLDRAITLDENYAWAIAVRGQTYRLLKRYEEALADLDRAIALDENYTWAIASRGQVYQSIKRYEEALVDFDRAIALDENYAWAIALRGETYRLLKRYEEALADFDRAIALDENDAWNLARRGETYRLMARYEEALTDFDRSIALDDKDAWAIALRGETYRLLKRDEEALIDFDRAIALNENYAWAIASRGQVYQSLKRYEEALVDFERAIAFDENDASVIASRGLIYLLTHRNDEALADFDRALSIEETEWRFYGRGLLYTVLNQGANALADLTRALDLAGVDYSKDPHDWQNTLNLMLYQLVAGDHVAAERFLQEALAGNAPVPRLKGAIQDLEELLTVLPDHAQARVFLQRIEAHLASRA